MEVLLFYLCIILSLFVLGNLTWAPSIPSTPTERRGNLHAQQPCYLLPSPTEDYTPFPFPHSSLARPFFLQQPSVLYNP